MTERDGFGPFLRRERERRGVTLEQIAAETKISVALLAGLERNDFSRWPGGLFRRAFVRSYAQIVGLDCDRVVRDFLRLFPPDEDQGRRHPDPCTRDIDGRGGAGGNGNAAGRVGRTDARQRSPSPRALAVFGTALALAGGVGVTARLAGAWPYGLVVTGLGSLAAIATSIHAARRARAAAPREEEAAVAITPTPQVRHITKRRAAEQRQTGRRHRPRRGGRRRPGAD